VVGAPEVETVIVLAPAGVAAVVVVLTATGPSGRGSASVVPHEAYFTPTASWSADVPVACCACWAWEVMFSTS
jgi:hypothetical protein